MASPRVTQEAIDDIVTHINALAESGSDVSADEKYRHIRAVGDFINYEAERMRGNGSAADLNPNNDPLPYDLPDASRLGKDSTIKASPIRARRIAIPPLGFDRAFPDAARLRVV